MEVPPPPPPGCYKRIWSDFRRVVEIQVLNKYSFLLNIRKRKTSLSLLIYNAHRKTSLYMLTEKTVKFWSFVICLQKDEFGVLKLDILSQFTMCI